VTSNSKEFRRIDRIEAKLTDWATYKSALGDRGVLGGVTLAPSQRIWVVAVGGDVRPAYDVEGTFTYTWGELSIDSGTGASLEFDAGWGPAWPPGFDSVTDLSS
jgi:hypothetical protein